MIRDGRMPTPEDAKQARQERLKRDLPIATRRKHYVTGIRPCCTQARFSMKRRSNHGGQSDE